MLSWSSVPHAHHDLLLSKPAHDGGNIWREPCTRFGIRKQDHFNVRIIIRSEHMDISNAAAGPDPPSAANSFINLLAHHEVALPSSSSRSSDQSFARQNYSAACEDAVNDLIGLEYNASYVYLVLFAYFDRDNVALPGFARYFEDSGNKERSRVKKLMKYQNMRGGKVQLSDVRAPPMTDFNEVTRGDALHAMEYTLAISRIINDGFFKLHEIASKEGDAQLQDYIEKVFLKDQVEDIKKISGYVSELRRIGQGHGVYHMDRIIGGHITENP